jgi:hypothetical protein
MAYYKPKRVVSVTAHERYFNQGAIQRFRDYMGPGRGMVSSQSGGSVARMERIAHGVNKRLDHGRGAMANLAARMNKRLSVEAAVRAEKVRVPSQELYNELFGGPSQASRRAAEKLRAAAQGTVGSGVISIAPNDISQIHFDNPRWRYAQQKILAARNVQGKGVIRIGPRKMSPQIQSHSRMAKMFGLKTLGMVGLGAAAGVGLGMSMFGSAMRKPRRSPYPVIGGGPGF